MKKRILSFTLVLTMLCSLLTTFPVSASSTFSDINGHWAKATIEELADKGVVNGKEDGKYDPEGKVTRAEISKLLVCTVEDEFENADGELSDVPEDAWFNPYVYEALNRSLFFLNELNGDNFMPNESADRETVAVWAMRLLGVEGEDETTPFVDNSSITNKKAVATAYNYGIMTGDEGKNTFRPKDTLTRAEAAIVIKKVMDKYQEMHTVRPSENIVEYKDDVDEIKATEDMNVLVSVDEEKGIFIFDKINDDIRNLKKDDLFLIKPCDAIPTGVAIRVKDIKISGNKATITQGDIQLDDVVETIDMSQKIELKPEHIVSGSLGEGVSLSYTGENSNDEYLADAEAKLGGLTVSESGGKLKIKYADSETLYKTKGGSVVLDLTATIENFEVLCDVQYHGGLKFDVKLTETHDETLNIDVNGSGKYDALAKGNILDSGRYKKDSFNQGHYTQGYKKDREALKDEIYNLWQSELGISKGQLKKDGQYKKDIDLASVNIPTPIAGLYVVFDLKLNVGASGEFSASITGTRTVTRGIDYKAKEGLNKITTVDENWNRTFAGEFDARVGASINGGLTYLWLATATLGIEGGVGFNASTEITDKVDQNENDTTQTAFPQNITQSVENEQTTTGEVHTCDVCVDLVLYGYLTIKAECKIGYGPVNKTLFSPSWDILNKDNAKIATGYLSFNHLVYPYLDLNVGQCKNRYIAPKVNEKSEDKTCRLNDSLTLFVRATNDSASEKANSQGLLTSKETSYVYQWYKDNAIIDGATSDVYQVANITENDFGTYRCIVALKDKPSVYTISDEIKVDEEKVEEVKNDEKTETVEVKTTSKSGSISENQVASFTFVPPASGTYHFENTVGEIVLININGDYKSNEGYYELIGGQPYNVNVEWGYADTQYNIEITGPIQYNAGGGFR